MALFNVRLGWWLGNPGPEGTPTYRHEVPRRAPSWSTTWATTEDKAYVYLSDGGHFENLGIYEMVRRRCRLIVVSDAGRDPASPSRTSATRCARSRSTRRADPFPRPRED